MKARSPPGTAASLQELEEGDAADLIRQVKKIRIVTRHMTRNREPGTNLSVLRGRGIEFVELREYVAGDDARAIDWKVTARMNAPYVREFSKEHERTVYIAIDVSGSGTFGSQVSKRRRMSEIAVSLLFAAEDDDARSGLCLFSDTVERFIPARRGKTHLYGLINTIVTHRPSSRMTDINPLLTRLAHIRRRSTIIILSDFCAPAFDRGLKLLQQHQEVIAIRVSDPREWELPDTGLIMLEDPESGEEVLVNTSDPSFRDRFRNLAGSETKKVDDCLRKWCAGTVPVLTVEAYERVLMRLFTGGDG